MLLFWCFIFPGGSHIHTLTANSPISVAVGGLGMGREFILIMDIYYICIYKIAYKYLIDSICANIWLKRSNFGKTPWLYYWLTGVCEEVEVPTFSKLYLTIFHLSGQIA